MSEPDNDPDRIAAENAIQHLVGRGSQRKPDLERDIELISPFLPGRYGFDLVECYISYLLDVCGYYPDFERDYTEAIWRTCSIFGSYFETAVRVYEGDDCVSDIDEYGVSLDTLKSYFRNSDDQVLRKQFMYMYLSCFRFIEIDPDELPGTVDEPGYSDYLDTAGRQAQFLKNEWRAMRGHVSPERLTSLFREAVEIIVRNRPVLRSGDALTQ